MVLFILWLIIGIINLIDMITGGKCSWLQYWCAYIVLIGALGFNAFGILY